MPNGFLATRMGRDARDGQVDFDEALGEGHTVDSFRTSTGPTRYCSTRVNRLPAEAGGILHHVQLRPR